MMTVLTGNCSVIQITNSLQKTRGKIKRKEGGENQDVE